MNEAELIDILSEKPGFSIVFFTGKVQFEKDNLYYSRELEEITPEKLRSILEGSEREIFKRQLLEKLTAYEIQNIAMKFMDDPRILCHLTGRTPEKL